MIEIRHFCWKQIACEKEIVAQNETKETNNNSCWNQRTKKFGTSHVKCTKEAMIINNDRHTDLYWNS